MRIEFVDEHQPNMKQRMLNRAVQWMGVLLVMFMTPALALARQSEEREIVDARLEGYARDVTLHGGGSGLTWLLFIVLGIIALAALFKSAHRTHLD